MTEQENNDKPITPIKPEIKTDKPEVEVKKKQPDPPVKPYKEADYKAFVKFYAMPGVLREAEYKYKTEGDFAKEHKLSQDTLTEWKKRKEFGPDVDLLLIKWGGDKTPDVLQALFDTIEKDGKAAEVKLWLQFIKGWKEGMIIEQPSVEKVNKLNKLLENADEPTKRKFAELLKSILPSNRDN